MNPTAAVNALYDERIELWRGIPAAWGIEEFRLARYGDSGNYVEGGYLFMANQIQPGLLGASVPGFGEDHATWMKALANFGGTVGWIDDHPDELGEISLKSDGARVVSYPYGPVTRKILRDLIKKQTLIHLELGARKIMVADYAGTEITNPADLALIDTLPVSAAGLILGAPHPAGGCRMGTDRAVSVTGTDHRVHGFDNLFVSDSSVFPTGVSMDPSLTIMGFSYVAAEHIRAFAV
jgi:choline dehydrogenase-like flavoprotein